MSLDVFLSVGRTSTAEQEEFVKLVERYLEANGFTPKTVGRFLFSNAAPLAAVKNLMRSCAGTVVIAFERFYIESGTEQRGSPDNSDISGQTLPTAWNQVEAGMACLLEQPVFMLVERGLRCDALLKDSNEWYVTKVALDKSVVTSSEFIGVFNSWKDAAHKYAGKGSDVPAKRFDATRLTPMDILKSLTLSQAWAIGAAIIGVLSAVSAAGYYVGTIVTKNEASIKSSVKSP